MSYHKKFETFLKAHNSRYTSQKKLIIDEIGKVKNHFEVDDFIAKMRKKTPPFSRATVYRTIKQLFDAGMVQKITTRTGKVYYEQTFVKKQHDHLICNQCGKITEFEESLVDSILEGYCQKIGFSAEYRSLHIFGVCSACS